MLKCQHEFNRQSTTPTQVLLKKHGVFCKVIASEGFQGIDYSHSSLVRCRKYMLSLTTGSGRGELLDSGPLEIHRGFPVTSGVQSPSLENGVTAFQWAFRIDAEELRKGSERVQTSFEDRFQALKWPLSKNKQWGGGVVWLSIWRSSNSTLWPVSLGSSQPSGELFRATCHTQF